MVDILTENQIALKILMSLFVLVLFVWIGRLMARCVAGTLLRNAKSKTIVQFVKRLTTWLVRLLELEILTSTITFRKLLHNKFWSEASQI